MNWGLRAYAVTAERQRKTRRNLGLYFACKNKDAVKESCDIAFAFRERAEVLGLLFHLFLSEVLNYS